MKQKLKELQHLCDELEGASLDKQFDENTQTELNSMRWQLQALINLLAADNNINLELEEENAALNLRQET